MSLDAGSIVALLAAAFVGGIVSGVAGFAFSLVTAGVVTRLLPPPSGRGWSGLSLGFMLNLSRSRDGDNTGRFVSVWGCWKSL